jgi:nicotinamidase/pyrazinamidase
MKKTHLITIDPQNDFCIANEFDGLNLAPDVRKALKSVERKGTLVVPGADKDMERLAAFIRNNLNRISEIHCTVDSHQNLHIAHPMFWLNSKQENPKPFTPILDTDVRNGTWRPFHPALTAHAQLYTDTLKKVGRNVLCIWPPHCLIETWGHGIVREVSLALNEWEIKNTNRVNYVTKGSNFLTEHYSGVQADVPDDSDPTTKLNTDLIGVLKEADEILITGEALSHCVRWTITDIANNFGNDNIKKFILLVDTSSSVPGFEKDGENFIKEMTARGMRLAKSTEW